VAEIHTKMGIRKWSFTWRNTIWPKTCCWQYQFDWLCLVLYILSLQIA